MRLVCPKCASEYEVDGTLFTDEGREVQCSNCENVWTQYPVVEEPPLRLDSAAAARPSERLPEAERDALSRQVQDELDAYGGAADADGEENEEELLAALRAQIEAEGGDFEKGDAAQSQRRNLDKAAQSAGIALDRPEDTADKPRRWGISVPDAAAEAAPATGLAAALKELEATPPARGSAAAGGGHGLRNGFIAALLIGAIGGGVYTMQDRIVEAYPPAEPILAQMNGVVDQGRTQVETLYAEYQPMVMGMIADFTAPAEDAPAE